MLRVEVFVPGNHYESGLVGMKGLEMCRRVKLHVSPAIHSLLSESYRLERPHALPLIEIALAHTLAVLCGVRLRPQRTLNGERSFACTRDAADHVIALFCWHVKISEYCIIHHLKQLIPIPRLCDQPGKRG